MDPTQRQRIAQFLAQERKDYISAVATTLKVLASTLASKMSMPPYMITPGEARGRFFETLESNADFKPENVNSPTMIALCAYLSASSTFTMELQTVLETIEDLVGVEDPEIWLRLHV